MKLDRGVERSGIFRNMFVGFWETRTLNTVILGAFPTVALINPKLTT